MSENVEKMRLEERYERAVGFLLGLKEGGVRVGIERMGELVEWLGHPERAVPVVHVAGTNGKGSVSAMLEGIFREAGWRTGLYTSPHLVRLGERVQVNRVELPREKICGYVEELGELLKGRAGELPTFFEWMTGMAFLEFKRERCDVAVVEVGLGGRLDATNVVVPMVSVVTSIGLDHCEFLGGTLESVAREKAGIVKEGVPVVLGRMPREAEEVIRAVAREKRAEVFSVREVFGEGIEGYPRVGLEGDYQRWNAGTAVLAARCAGMERWKLDEGIFERALGKVRWSCRWERRFAGGRKVILDASHNLEGAMVLEENLRRLAEEEGELPVVVCGVLGAARAKPLLEVVGRWAKAIYLVRPNQARACELEELRGMVPAEFGGEVVLSGVREIFGRGCVCGIAGGGTVVVTGSIYLAGEVLEVLEGREGEGKLQDF